MKQRIRQFLAVLIVFVGCLGYASLVLAQNKEPAAEENPYRIAKIISPEEEGETTYGETSHAWKTFNAELTNGPEKGKRIILKQDDFILSHQALEITTGDLVVVIADQTTDEQNMYALVDAYRINALWWVAGVFALLAILFGRLRGVTSLLGLLVSTGVIVWYIIPRIIEGGDPLWISLIGSVTIASVSLFLAHGFNKRTVIAYAGTLVTLILSTVIAVQTVSFTHLFGTGSEDSLFVLGDLPTISLQGLLLGGIMLGLLGVLDDITTAQSAVVDELHEANPSLGIKELYRRGLSVGREHIASLINTLFLAYAGAALPLFLLFSMANDTELWTIFNNEMVAEEIIRALVGSACLILAVPITTYMAAYVYGKNIAKIPENPVRSNE